MSLDHRTEILYERHGEKYPALTIKVDGVHDVGRIIAALARGNCEHGELARNIGRDLNRTATGQATLDYLVNHGGPNLAPPSCEPCQEGDHEGCWSILSDSPEDECGCYDADESGRSHETERAHARAMGMA